MTATSARSWRRHPAGFAAEAVLRRQGIITGLAKHFSETIRLSEERCMHQGAPDCTLIVTAGAEPA